MCIYEHVYSDFTGGADMFNVLSCILAFKMCERVIPSSCFCSHTSGFNNHPR